MPSYVPAKKNTALVFGVSLISQANTKIHQANPTLAAGDVKVVGDAGSVANITTLPTVDSGLTKRVIVSLSAAEMNFDNVYVIFSDAAGAEWCDLAIGLQTSARQIDDLATPTNITAGTIASVSGNVGGIAGVTLPSVVGDATVANQTTINNNVLTRLATSGYTAPGGPVASVTAGVTLADGAITENKITLPTEATGTPTGFLQLVMWIAGMFGWRKVVKDSNALTIGQFMADGTTPKTTSSYTSTGGVDTINKAT